MPGWSHEHDETVTTLRRSLAEREAEIARLNESAEAARRLLAERDARLAKLEALGRLHFGHAAFEALRERDARIAELERRLAEQRDVAQGLASDLWRQTERIESLELEVTALRQQVGRAVGA